MVAWSDDWFYYMTAYQRYLYNEHRERFEQMQRMATEMWVVYHGKEPVMFIGLSKYTLLGSHTYLWTINFREFCWLHLRDLKRLLEKNMKRFDVLTAVVMGSNRLAKFCGFDYSHEEHGGTIYARRR